MGKSSTSTSQVSVPPEVLANYQSSYYRASQAAETPFQRYGGQFVAPLTALQQSGVAQSGQYGNEAAPYFQLGGSEIQSGYQQAQPYNAAATSLVQQAGQQAQLDPNTINRYLSPYLGTVLGSTEALVNQQNQQAQAGQLGDAIRSGAFGGDRAGIAAANLAQQQQLAGANIYSTIANQGYTNAQQTALQSAAAQQTAGQGLAGIGQQFLNQGLAAGQGYGQLGAEAQGTALQGAQAQLGAGQVEQQTQQAQDTALYNQFLQEQSYPFQVSQFLANIAEGTGALSGSTTTTKQPGGFFSDERLKEDIEPVGETYDGQKIIRFRYKGDPRKQLGLSAQQVEKRHPDAVGVAGGYRVVDYGKATEDAAHRGHFARGGDTIELPRSEYRIVKAEGGGFNLGDLAALLQAHSQMYGGVGLGRYNSDTLPHGGSSYVPGSTGVTPHLAVASPSGQGTTPAQNAQAVANLGKSINEIYREYKKPAKSSSGVQPTSDWASKGPLDTSQDLPQQPPPDTSNLASDAIAADDAAFSEFARGGSTDNLELDIPEDQSTASLSVAQTPTQSKGLFGSFASGGMTDGGVGAGGFGSLDIPNEPSSKSTAIAQTPATNDHTLQDIAEIAAVVAAFANRGGAIKKRHGYATDGTVDDDTSYDPLGNPTSPASTEYTGPDLGLLLAKLGKHLYGTSRTPLFDEPPRSSGVAAAPAPAAVASQRPISRPSNLPVQAPQVGVAAAQPTAAPEPAPAAEPTQDLSQDIGYSNYVPNLSAEKPEAGKKDIWDRIGSTLGSIGDSKFLKTENLIPILTGISAMGTAPTRSLGVALASGIGAGAQAYLPAQAQQAKIAQVKTQSAQSQAEALKTLQSQAPEGFGVEFGPAPAGGRTFTLPNGMQYHYLLKAATIGAGATGTAAAPAVPSGPITQDDSGKINIGPSSAIDDSFRKLNPQFDPTRQYNAVTNNAMVNVNPAIAQQAETDTKVAQGRLANEPQAENTQRNLIELSNALNSMTPGELVGQGAGIEQRAKLANIYATMSRMFGAEPDSTVTSDLGASQIINKINTQLSSQLAHTYGEKAASIAQGFKGALPSDALQLPAANLLTANMMVQNQKDRDFQQYYNAYVTKYGTAFGVNQAFNDEMNPSYAKEIDALRDAMTRRDKAPISPAQYLQQHPEESRNFNEGYKKRNGSQARGFGRGLSRYFQ